MNKLVVSSLKSEVVRFAREGNAARKLIQSTTREARYDAWNEKRAIGEGARVALLAYAFARGVPYRVVEPTSRERPADYSRTPAEWRREFASQIAVWMDYDHAPVDAMLAWLEVPETAERRARREARIAASRQLRAARRVAEARRVA